MNAQELIVAVENALGVLEGLYRGEATESDLYEAALFALSIEAARRAGGNVTIVARPTTGVPEIRFRRSPGNLWTGNFNYASISFPGSSKRLEAHLGVYVVGTSGVAHECDVALLDGEEANRSRTARVHPRKSGLVAAIEAKHYVVSPGLGIGRAFIGLADELGGKKCCLAFPAQGSASIRTLIARRPSECLDEVIPGSVAAERLTSLLDQSVRNWLAR